MCFSCKAICISFEGQMTYTSHRVRQDMGYVFNLSVCVCVCVCVCVAGECQYQETLDKDT